ncbi:hypothetical protein DVR12_02585 [Chitinophaga silvatica]|uniref:RRM domain-containing protein n=1 Tax=Chitinophaga silvatica TaxID=2282649 RepID=A0A3E1YH65_9BACT|nr:RNA-binding protein [Chitinophaga silvatica]RFS26694.1 hypothetical protein DVR12_02585 [Chitinophaga silvatica]
MNISVGNLSGRIIESELSELFTPFGIVYRAEVIYDNYMGRSTGFAFNAYAEVAL